MSKVYDDSRYGIEKILTFPTISLVTALNTVKVSFPLTEAITPTEFGCWVTTALANSGTASGVQLAVSATALIALGTITVPTGTAIGANKTATLTSTTSVSNGDLLIIRVTLSDAIGSVRPYMKYREKYAE